jgi:branched-chain amino acid transport system substrate-binding protein
MTVNDSDSHTDRRTLLQATGAAGLAMVAGCVSTTDDEASSDEGTETDDGGTETDDEAEEATGPYQIGMVNSLTGSLSAFGERNQRGKDLALSDVNEVGIGGRELDIIVEDSTSEPQGGVSAAQKLVNQNGVPFLIGAVGSGVSLSIYESVVEETDVVQLSQNSTGLGLTEFPGLLRVSPSGQAQSVALANIIAEDGYDEVAVTYVNDDFGQTLTDAFVEAYDGEVVYNSAHDRDQQSYSSVVSEMNDSGADAWLFNTYQDVFTSMVNEVFSAGYEAQFYGTDSTQAASVLENTPEGSMEGMKIALPSAPVDQDNYQTFASRFEEEYGDPPTTWAAFAYDCVITAAIAIRAADEFSGAALGEVVRDVTRPEGEAVTSFEAASDILADGGGPGDVDYQGVSGPIDLDENGDPVGFLQILEVEDHEYVEAGFIEG